MKPELLVQELMESGFVEAGCWELNSACDLVHAVELPKQAGVYAFAINGVVQYVGLASTSLRQRLRFYRKPGASQRTNMRLNEIIRGKTGQGAVVQILIAHPPEGEWNGLKISGAEGLEAGLIREFDLPWNMRGASRGLTMTVPKSGSGRQSGIAVKILELVRHRPGMTELEIAKLIYGPAALQPQVNQVCRKLVAAGSLTRRGAGRSDPFTYHFRDHAALPTGEA